LDDDFKNYLEFNFKSIYAYAGSEKKGIKKMKYEIENMRQVKIAYIRRVGAYGIGNAHTMKALKEWASKHGLMDDSAVIFGIAWDDPMATPPENCRYDACIAVSDAYTADGGIDIGAIGGGSYAVFKIKHTTEAMQRAWGEIFPELAKNQRNFDPSRPILERYAVDLLNDGFCEICVPVM